MKNQNTETKEVKVMNIYESISKVMEQLGAVGKTSKNQSQGFMYRGIDAVMNALSPALTANHVFVTPEVLEQTREERTSAKGVTLIYSIIKVKYTFYAEDGTSVSATVIGEGMDSGDKATNKAMSIAFKYACFQVFCIPTEEMIDPDAECHEVKAKTVTADMVKALEREAGENGLTLEEVCKAYKVAKPLDLTMENLAQIRRNWGKLQEWKMKELANANAKKGE